MGNWQILFQKLVRKVGREYSVENESENRRYGPLGFKIMKTTVLRKLGYEGTFIYILQYDYTFQYLFAWNNEVYRQEIIVTPYISSWQRWAWWLGLCNNPYSREQLEKGEQIILSGATKSIDAIKPTKRREKKKTKQGSCQWQARADNEGKPIYLCITHNQNAPLEDNPHHLWKYPPHIEIYAAPMPT